MTLDHESPIPVLVVGEDATTLGHALNTAFSNAGEANALSCAAFDTPAQAANASQGAMRLILIGVGPDARTILSDPVWGPWEPTEPDGASGIARIGLCDDHASLTVEALEEGERGAAVDVAGAAAVRREVHWLSPAQQSILPDLTRLVARLLIEGDTRRRLERELATERACEPLADCLEPGKLYSMAVDLLLSELGRERGLAIFAPSPAIQTPGVAARGFDEALRDQLSRQVLEEKSIEAAMGQGEVSVIPWGPLHHVLGRVGIESPGPLLSVPLSGDVADAGHVWILSEGRRFDAGDLAAARTIARRASAALATAEQYHHAKERAFIDDVTGVYNARYLLATADNEIQRAARYGNPLSVLFLDLDRFKGVNDRYGHLIGSETLRTLSVLLGQCVRQVDTLARYGGDEFTILLVDTDHETALRIAERIRDRVEAYRFEAGREGQLQLTISIGVATCPLHGEERESVLDAADKAMYCAKSRGRNRVCSANQLDQDGDPDANSANPPARR